MATGRTLQKWVRIYAGGYELCSDARSIGPLIWQYDIADLTTMCDEVRGGLPVHARLGIGVLNGVMDNTASHLHDLPITSGSHVVMIPIGIRAAPAAGDPVYNGRFYIDGYESTDDGGASVVNVPFGDWDVANLINYSKPWGVLLHANGAETAVNTAIGIDDRGAHTDLGGYMVYQVFASVGTGNVTIKVQDADTNTNPSFGDLSGATSGTIANTAIPTAGIVAIGTTAHVHRYLRWQIVLSGITSVTFALAFVRI